MDEICPIPARIRTLYRINQMFMQICNDERIFALLYEFISFSGFVSLSATNSQIKKSINKHEQVQVYILQLKVKKLKERQFKRLYPNPFGVDFRIYNPYTLPIYIQDLEAGSELTNQEIQKERAIAEIQKLRNDELVNKRNWGKWRANKRVENRFDIQPRRNSYSQQPQSRFSPQEQVSIQQQIRVINEAQKIVQLNREFQSKLLLQYTSAPNQLQAIKNKHFVEKILKKDSINDRNFVSDQNLQKKIRSAQVQRERQLDQIKALQIAQYDEFRNAWSDKIRKRAIKKIFKTETTPQYPSWIPLPSLPTHLLPIVSKNLGNLLEIPGLLNAAKSKVSSFLSNSNSQ